MGKKFIKTILILIVVILALSAMVKLAIDFKKSRQIAREKLIVIEGENPTSSNYADGVGRIYKNIDLMSEKALELLVAESIPGGYYLTYEFEIKEAGIYNIILCGPPPGPLGEGSKWYSPYSITLDGAAAKHFSEELLLEEWPQYRKYNYVEGGYFYIKALAISLEAGMHELTININERRKHDGNFTFYIDAIIISPEGFKPERNIDKIPKELFW